MKNKIVSWFRFFLIILSVIMLISVIVILHSLRTDDPYLIQLFHSNIRNTIYIGSVLFFIVVVTAYFFLPVHLKRSLSDISNVLDDFKRTVYNTELDLEEKKNSLDNEVYDILRQLMDAQKEIQKNNRDRKAKVFEHYSRITVLLRLVPDGVLIADLEGNIIFINDMLTEAFPQLEAETNILEKSYPAEIENHIKKLIQISLKQKKRQEPIQCFIPNLKRHITVDSALVRQKEGEVNGIVLVVQNLEKRKIERKQDKEKETERVEQ